MLPLETNIREAYANGQDAEQQFIQNLALFLCTFLKERGSLVEKKQLSDALLKVCSWAVIEINIICRMKDRNGYGKYRTPTLTLT